MLKGADWFAAITAHASSSSCSCPNLMNSAAKYAEPHSSQLQRRIAPYLQNSCYHADFRSLRRHQFIDQAQVGAGNRASVALTSAQDTARHSMKLVPSATPTTAGRGSRSCISRGTALASRSMARCGGISKVMFRRASVTAGSVRKRAGHLIVGAVGLAGRVNILGHEPSPLGRPEQPADHHQQQHQREVPA
jgi:hypothetical protein